MCVGELPPGGGEAVDARGFHFHRPVAAEITVTEIIGENEHDVGRTICGLGGYGGNEEECAEGDDM